MEILDDYKKLRDVLAGSEVSFKHFQLDEENEYKIVLRPISLDIPVEEVKEDLVFRMRRGPKMLLNTQRDDNDADASR